MKKTLTAIALFAALATGATTANANLHAAHNEGLQNYYYYFGTPCCDRIAPLAMNTPCGVPAPTCGNPCGECAPQAAYVEMEQVCTTCDCNPCGGSSFNILNPFSYFG